MTPRSLLTFAAVVSVAACASAGTGSPADGPAPLAHTVPQGGEATYMQADTILVELDAGGQMIEVRQAQASTLAMAFREVAGGTEVTATFEAFDGVVDNPMAGQQRFTVDAIEGPLVFSLTPRGEATVTSSPTIETRASALLNAESLAATIFPRLPGRVVTSGTQWTDTLDLEAEVPSGVIHMNSVTEYTVRGDSVVDGETLLAVDFVSEDTRFAEVTEAGMDVVQDVAGTMRGHFLWDTTRNRLHSQVGTGRYTGTMEVPGAPFPLGMSIDVVSRLGLAGG